MSLVRKECVFSTNFVNFQLDTTFFIYNNDVFILYLIVYANDTVPIGNIAQVLSKFVQQFTN